MSSLQYEWLVKQNVFNHRPDHWNDWFGATSEEHHITDPPFNTSQHQSIDVSCGELGRLVEVGLSQPCDDSSKW